MTRGRPPLGAEIVDRLEGSSQAKDRLRTILRTLSGEMTIPQACQELGIGESRFHEMRGEVLQDVLENLEGKPRGRPPDASDSDARVQQLQQQVLALAADLRASQIREELAIMLPRLGRKPEDASGRKKKDRRK
jgi:cytochrome P450